MLSYQVAQRVADGELSLVLEAFEPAALPIHVVYQNTTRVPAKVRTCVDFLVERLRQDFRLKPVHPGAA